MNYFIKVSVKYFSLSNIYLMFLILLTSSCTKRIPVERSLSGLYTMNTDNIEFRTLSGDSAAINLDEPIKLFMCYDSIHDNQVYYRILPDSYTGGGVCKDVNDSIINFELGFLSIKAQTILPKEGANYDILCKQIEELRLKEVPSGVPSGRRKIVTFFNTFGRIELRLEKNGNLKLGGDSYLLFADSVVTYKLEIIDAESPVFFHEKQKRYRRPPKIIRSFIKMYKKIHNRIHKRKNVSICSGVGEFATMQLQLRRQMQKQKQKDK